MTVTFSPNAQGTRSAEGRIFDMDPDSPYIIPFTGTGSAELSNAVPLVHQPVVPAAAVPGSASFQLTVNGVDFISGATVNWDGAPLTTTFVSGNQLTASVPSSKFTAPHNAANPSSVTCIPASGSSRWASNPAEMRINSGRYASAMGRSTSANDAA